MKKKRTILLLIVVLLACFAIAAEKSLTVLHVNDVHSSFDPHKLYNVPGIDGTPMGGGMLVLSGYLNHYRQDDDVLFMIAGDVFQGSLVDVLTEGQGNVDVLNELMPDVYTIGNHELDHGLARYKQMQAKMEFPVVSANVFEAKSGDLLAKQKSIILKANGLKVLVIGLLNTDYNKGDYKVIDYVEAVRSVVKDKKNKKADITILLSHAGYAHDKKIAESLTESDGVDIIIGGHTHTVLDEATVVNDIVIVQAGANADYLGKIDMVVDNKKNNISSYEYNLVPLLDGKYEADEYVAEVVKKYNDMLGDEVEEVIAHLQEPLLHPSRVEETELGNFAADVLLEYFDVDLSFQGSGGIRKPVPKEVKMKHILESIPFRNTFRKFRITGKQLRVVLENNAKSADIFQMPKTLSYTFDSSKPEGNRVLSIKFKGKEITDDQVFSAVTNNYVWGKDGGVKYFGMKNQELISNGGFEEMYDVDSDIYIGYLRKHEGNMPSFAKSNRIVDVAEGK